MKPKGNWVAAPMNIHRINWLWANKTVLDAAGITELPKTWAEFNADCDKIVAAGLHLPRPLSPDWTDATTFEVVVYGQDIDLFKKAFVEGDIDALRSPAWSRPSSRCALMVIQVHGSRHRRPRLRQPRRT